MSLLATAIDREEQRPVLSARSCVHVHSSVFASMVSSIAFTLNVHTQSSHAHGIRPTLPTIFAGHDTRQTITINKISSALSKKYFNNTRQLHLQTKECFLPITPTLVKTPSTINIDIQSKLGTSSLPFCSIHPRVSSLFRIDYFENGRL